MVKLTRTHGPPEPQAAGLPLRFHSDCRQLTAYNIEVSWYNIPPLFITAPSLAQNCSNPQVISSSSFKNTSFALQGSAYRGSNWPFCGPDFDSLEISSVG